MKHMMCVMCAGMLISFAVHAGEAQQDVAGKQAVAGYIPGMGEIMGATQMRHAKLWFAAKAGNWDLASYEVDEIEEGLADAVKYHPVFKKGAPVSAMLDKFTSQPLSDIRKAIDAKDSRAFRKSFDELTLACNECHEAASQGFIVMKRPSILQFSNQDFAVKTR